MSHDNFDAKLDSLFEAYDRTQEGKRDNREEALSEEAQFLANFVSTRANILRPAMEKLGSKLRLRDHDYSITEGDFRPPYGSRAQADEAFIKMFIFMSHLKDRSRHAESKIPFISFTTEHRTRKVIVHTSDYTESGGSVTKHGAYDLNQMSNLFVEEKFLFVFRMLARK